MPNHEQIYQEQAARYDELISKQPSLYKTINEIKPIKGLDIVDLGAGTGRLTSVLADDARSIIALDESQAMLDVLRTRLQESNQSNWRVSVADHRNLPLDDNAADLIVSGWSVCYLGSSNVPEWENNIDRIIHEMKRVLRPGGSIIIFETMGTGCETPEPPSFLKPYYSLLEQKYGFSHQWMRLDYTFDHVEETKRLVKFFFGEDLAKQVVKNQWKVVPECAGIWWLHL